MQPGCRAAKLHGQAVTYNLGWVSAKVNAHTRSNRRIKKYVSTLIIPQLTAVLAWKRPPILSTQMTGRASLAQAPGKGPCGTPAAAAPVPRRRATLRDEQLPAPARSSDRFPVLSVGM